MITLESITEKLGFNPLEVDKLLDTKDGNLIDDTFDPFGDKLTHEELRFIFELALKTPSCYKHIEDE